MSTTHTALPDASEPIQMPGDESKGSNSCESSSSSDSMLQDGPKTPGQVLREEQLLVVSHGNLVEESKNSNCKESENKPIQAEQRDAQYFLQEVQKLVFPSDKENTPTTILGKIQAQFHGQEENLLRAKALESMVNVLKAKNEAQKEDQLKIATNVDQLLQHQHARLLLLNKGHHELLKENQLQKIALLNAGQEMACLRNHIGYLNAQRDHEVQWRDQAIKNCNVMVSEGRRKVQQQAFEIQLLKTRQESLEKKLKDSENEALNLELKVWDMEDEADKMAGGTIKEEVEGDEQEYQMVSIKSEEKTQKRRGEDMEAIGKKRRFA